MFGNFEPADLAFLSHTYSDHYPQPYEEVKETSVLQVIGWLKQVSNFMYQTANFTLYTPLNNSLNIFDTPMKLS